MYLHSICLGLKRGSDIVALGPKYILYRYMDPFRMEPDLASSEVTTAREGFDTDR